MLFSFVKNQIFTIKFSKFLKTINITNIDSLNGLDFEQFIEDIFKYLGFKTSTTPITGDNGIDIIACKGNVRLGIQAKLYYKHNISNSAVQEAYSGKSYYKCTHTIVVTNWNFSKPAQTLASELHVGLIDRLTLSKILKNNKNQNKELIETILQKVENETI